MKLLLIDDDEVDRRMVMRLLSGIDPPPNIVQATPRRKASRFSEPEGSTQYSWIIIFRT